MELLRLKKRALSIILPEENYQSAVENLKYHRLLNTTGMRPNISICRFKSEP